jgi:DNA-binding transcriptional MocR family regulator
MISKEIDPKTIFNQRVTGRKIGYKVTPDADVDIFPEGAHGFKPKIQPFLDKWQRNNPKKEQVFYHVGEPEEAPSSLVIDALRQMVTEPVVKKNFAYQPPEGLPELRKAIVGHTERAGLYKPDIIDKDDVIAGGSGKFMIHAIARALRKKDLVAGVFTPGYPGHISAAIKATHVDGNGGEHGIVGIPVTEEYHKRRNRK